MSSSHRSSSNQESFLNESSQRCGEEETFIKTDPTPVMKYRDDNYGSLDQELEAMLAMNKVIPDYVPAVVDYDVEGGEVTEIEYDFIEGDTVKNIMTGRTDKEWQITSEDYGELEEIVEKLHDNGLVHGDLIKDNIIYGEDGWTLLDPAGVMEDDADYNEALKKDNNRLSRIEGCLSNSRHQPHF